MKNFGSAVAVMLCISLVLDYTVHTSQAIGGSYNNIYASTNN